MFGIFDQPKSSAIRAMFTILREGHELQTAVDGAYSEIFSRAGNVFIFWRIADLCRTWFNPDARYMGILLLADLIENSGSPRLQKKSRKVLNSILKSEKNPRNLDLIKSSLNTASPATGAAKKMYVNYLTGSVHNIKEARERKVSKRVKLPLSS